MKKFATLLSILILQQILFAQGNAGIGMDAPDASVALDIFSDCKGVLLPRITLNSTIDPVTIASYTPGGEKP